MKNSRIRSTSYFLIVSLCLISATSARAADSVIKVGSMIPETGAESGEAKGLSDAVKLAVQQINAGGGARGKKLELVFADTKSGPATALQAYEKLIHEDHVVAVVAPFKSAQVIALTHEAKKSKTPTFIGGTNTRLTEDGGTWLFRTRPDDGIAAQAMVTAIKDEGKYTKVGIIHDNGALGVGGSNLFMKDAATAGLSIVKNIGFDFGAADFETPIKAIKDAGAQILIVYAANLEESGRVLQAYARVGKPMACMASASSMSKVSLSTAKEAAEGVFGMVDFVFGSRATDKKYLADYHDAYHEEPDPIAAYGYDSIKLLAKAIDAVGEDAVKIHDYVLKIQGYEGVLGTYSFDEKGNGLHSVSLVKVENGQPKYLKTIGPK